MSKKILYVITKSNWGGAQRYVFDLATGMPKEKYAVKVVCGGSGYLADRLRGSGIEVITVDSLGRDVNVGKDIASLKELWKIIKKEQPDILHLNSSKIGITGSIIGRMLGVGQIIFTAHAWAFNEDRPFYQKIAVRLLHWLTVILCHTTIAVSDNIASAFRNWPFIKNKLTVIHNGIDPIDYVKKTQARSLLLGEKSAKASKAYWVGIIAELHPIKGHIYAIQAFAGVLATVSKPVILVIIGDGEERSRLEKEITRLNLNEKVFLLGFKENAASYLKAFDLFLLPSLSEAFSYVTLEAGMAKVPVIATNVGGISEIVDDMQSGILIRPRNIREISESIVFLLDHGEKSKEFARNLFIKVSKKYSLSQMLDATIKLYS